MFKIASFMGIDDKSPQLIAWQEQVHEAYTEQEILRLFSQNVSIPFDRVAKKLISKNAVESALIVAVSPLAIVDMFFIAWRNIRLINQLAKLYGIELAMLVISVCYAWFLLIWHLPVRQKSFKIPA